MDLSVRCHCVFQVVDKCFNPQALGGGVGGWVRGVLELNELESSSFKDGMNSRKLLTQPA